MKYTSLSPRHLALLREAGENKTAQEISDATGFALRDVVDGLAEAASRLGVRNVRDAAYVVYRLGLIERRGKTWKH